MATKSASKGSMIRPFMANIQKALNNLPSQAEKEELEDGCTRLIAFLTYLKNNLTNLPTIEDMASVQQQIQRIEDFVNRAESDPVLRTALGIRRSASKKRPGTVTESEREKATKTLGAFNAMQIDEVRRRLGNEKMYTIRELRAIANELGIKSIQRLSRTDLLHRITTKIANFRGYQSLGGMNNQ